MSELRSRNRVLRALLVGLLTAALLTASGPADAKATGTIRLVQASQPVLKGDAITLAGRFRHAPHRVFVIQKKLMTRSWVVVKGTRGTTTKAGRYRATFTPTRTFTYRALLPATRTKPPRYSRTLQVGVTTGWRQVSAGGDSTCGIWSDRTLWCWGNNNKGQLGTATNAATVNPNPTPIQVMATGPDQTWRSVSVGQSHTCAVRTDGTLWCWGQNYVGELGSTVNNGLFVPNPTPAQVLDAQPDQTWRSVSAGYLFTCAIRTDKTLWCFGGNTYGQLGNAINLVSSNPNPTPQQVFATGPDQTWRAVTTGLHDTCGLRADQTLWCWGFNLYGELGNPVKSGTNDATTTPTQVVIPDTDQLWLGLTAGESHVCGVRLDHSLWCWGSNLYGEQGTYTNFGTNGDNPTPTQVLSVGDQTWNTVAAGEDHSCSIRATGTLWCWGHNTYGELGVATNVGTSNPNPGPMQVVISGNDQTWLSVSAGTDHTCGIRPDHTLWCWGTNFSGQLGNETDTEVFAEHHVPAQVPAPVP